LNQQQLAFLRTVKSNTDRLNILVDDLLNLSQIEAGKVALVMRPLDLREITAEVISDAELRVRDEEKPLQFVLDAASRLPFGLGDAERVRQVLSNLVGNACNYTPAGGRITVRLRECGPEIQVDVQDNGIGVAPEMQERIFQRFYRGEDPLVLATAGTGLGLSIARTIVEMHHGRIWLESNGMAGQGSTFSFTLPVYHNQEEE
jgi:signal transduction histidine kinase